MGQGLINATCRGQTHTEVTACDKMVKLPINGQKRFSIKSTFISITEVMKLVAYIFSLFVCKNNLKIMEGF